MSYFDWTNALDVGVGAMNREHQRLIALMNALYDGNEAGEPKTRLLARLDELGKYTIEHFQHEEAYMESIGYPKLTTHRGIHRNLLQQLDQHVSTFRASADKTLPKQLFTFLKLWLSAHIQGIDIKYAKMAKSA